MAPRRQAPADLERVSQLQSGISFCHAESSALGQQNKEAREKAPLCLGLNARPAGKEGFPRARDMASQACLLRPGLGSSDNKLTQRCVPSPSHPTPTSPPGEKVTQDSHLPTNHHQAGSHTHTSAITDRHVCTLNFHSQVYSQ